MSDSDLTELRKQCITSLYLCTDNISKYLDLEKEAEFSKLMSYVEQYCKLEAEQEVAIQALEKAKKETDTSNVETIESRFSEHLANLTRKRLKVNNHPYVLELNSRIKKGREKVRQTLDESDLAITESQEQYIDPITKMPISDPVKNTVCGHIYERDAILEMISMNSKIKCPVVGCGNRQPVQMEHLLNDEELRFRLALTQHSTMVQEVYTLDLDNTE